MTSATDTQKDLAHLARALKAPRLLAPIARKSNWSHEEYLAAVLSQEVFNREASGSLIRIKAAGFDCVKSLEDFNYDFQRAAPCDVIAHMATGTYLQERAQHCPAGSARDRENPPHDRARNQSLRARTPCSFRFSNNVGEPAHR